MTCADAIALVPAWADRELSLRDSGDLERHLASCPACSAKAGEQAAFVKGLREALPRDPMPAVMRARVLATLGSAQSGAGARPEAAFSFLAWARERAGLQHWALSAACAALFCLGLLSLQPSLDSDAWTRFFRDEHQAHSSVDLRAQLRTPSQPLVAAWLAQKLGHPVHVPLMKDAELVGARLSMLRGKAIGLAVYQARGRTLSLFFGDPKLLCPGYALAEDQLYGDAGQPYSLVAWEHKGHFHVAVAELPLGVLKELAHQCQTSAI